MDTNLCDYTTYFKALTAFNRKSLEARMKIFDGYFAAVRQGLPTYRQQVQLDEWVAKHRLRQPPQQQIS